MLYRGSIGAVALAAALSTASSGAQAFDETKYPDWKGQWVRIGGGGQYDPSKPAGRGQQPPLTPEYQAIWEANLAEAAAGGQLYNTQVHCLPGGMPRMMMAYEPMEIIITPAITYVQISFNNEFRRIYSDGRDWPKDQEPNFLGYSIGKWVDENGDGRYDVLEIETRGFKGPRSFDSTGLPLHRDNQTVVKERIYRDKADPNVLYDEITTIDHALTRPWTAIKNYNREQTQRPVWREFVCAENNPWIAIGKENYYLSSDGYLMPTRKDQPPPDTRFFNRTSKR
jgi:hypothetical protein